MPTSYQDANVQCPYYRHSDKRRISCEGMAEGCYISLSFDTERRQSKHREIFCDAKYQNCEIYRMLEEKYEAEKW